MANSRTRQQHLERDAHAHTNERKLAPYEELRKLLQVEDDAQALARVRQLIQEVQRLRYMLANVTVISVVAAGDQVSVQLPPSAPPQDYPLEVLKQVDDLLLSGTSATRRMVRTVERQQAQQAQEALREAQEAQPIAGTATAQGEAQAGQEEPEGGNGQDHASPNGQE